MATNPTRGIVVAPSLSTAGGGLELQSISEEEIRHLTLYWDIIAVGRPKLPIGDWPWPGFGRKDFQTLIDEGILREHEVFITDISNLTSDDIYPLAQSKLARTLMKEGHMLWSLGQCAEGLRLPSRAGHVAELFEVDLYNSMPAPTADTPLEKILEFKLRRKPELLQLRHAIDDLYETISSAEDKVRARAGAIEKVDIAFTAIDRTLTESKLKRSLKSMSMYIGLRESPIIGATLGALGASQIGVPKELGALAGIGVNAAVTFFTHRMEDRANLPDSSKDFAYAYHAKKTFKRQIALESGIAGTTSRNTPVTVSPTRLDEAQMAAQYHMQAKKAQDFGDFETAEELYKKSLEFESKISNVHGEAMTYGALGSLMFIKDGETIGDLSFLNEIADRPFVISSPHGQKGAEYTLKAWNFFRTSGDQYHANRMLDNLILALNHSFISKQAIEETWKSIMDDPFPSELAEALWGNKPD